MKYSYFGKQELVFHAPKWFRTFKEKLLLLPRIG
jgi:hypothetical protein